MSDLSLRQVWLSDQLRSQVANALAYPIAPGDRELFGQLRTAASELLADVVAVGAETIHEQLKLDDGLRTPLWATAFAVETVDGHLRWYWEYLPGEPDFVQYLGQWAQFLQSERPIQVTSIADSYALGLPIPHTYVGWCPVRSRHSAQELDELQPFTPDNLSQALETYVDTESPMLRARNEAVPTQLPTSVESQMQKVIDICRIGLESSTDVYNRERYQYFLDICTTVRFTEHSSSLMEKPWLTARSPTTGAEAAILDQDNRILLMQRTDTGQWAMPGGACEVGETAASTAAREAYEEIGVDLTVESLNTVVDNRLITDVPVSIDIIAIYTCYLTDPEQKPIPTGESLQAQWFSQSELNELEFFHGHGTKVRRLVNQL